jgi:hypothetical protein
MQVVVNKDSKFLIANSDHKNFTETNEVIGEGNILKGEPKNIQGLRRGEPFTYKLFITNDEKIIYLKNVTPMETTEVTLGADSQRSSTVVNLVPAETFSKVKTTGLVLGALAGFAYAKYNKQDTKKIAMYIFAGAAIGYASAFIVDRNRKGTVKSSN